MMKMQWNSITVSEYNELRKAVGWKIIPDEQAKTGLRQSNILTIVENGKIIGMARSISDGIQSFIVDVIVRPEYQAQGIGTKIMSEMLKYEKETTCAAGDRYVSVFAMEGMESFYADLGFLKRPNILQGAGMTLKLTPAKHFKFEDF